MRALLDLLYKVSLWSSAGMIFLILVLVTLQMVARLTGTVIPGVDEYAGYAVVCGAFLGLAGTLKARGHIRVQLLLQKLPARAAAWCEVGCGLLGVALTGFVTYSAIDFTHDSWQFGEVAGGLVSTPMWIPQSLLAVGLILLEIAMLDFLATAISDLRAGRAPAFDELQHGSPVLPGE